LRFSYRIFGLIVCSNSALPGLETIHAGSDRADVCLHLGGSPAVDRCNGEELFFSSSIRTESGEAMQRIWKIADGALLRIDYADSTQFWLDTKGREVWSRWQEKSSFEDAVSYLLGPILGYVLRLRGVICLHASAVRCGQRAAVFVGPGGAGKSTLAAALALRGHGVVSEDVVALHECNNLFYTVSAYPYVGLWPDSVRALYGPGKDFAAFSPNFPKRLVRSDSSRLRFSAEMVDVDSLFLLEERSSNLKAPFLESIDKREALMWLVGNTYANLLLDDEMRALEFAFLGRLLNSVPVKRLRAHEDFSRIAALCELLEKEVASGQSRARLAAER
jgi:hypothetical protein